MRQATKQDIEMENKGIKMNKKFLKAADENLLVMNKQREFMLIKRDHEDFLRPYNRKEEDKQLDNAIEKYEQDKRIAEFKIKQAEKHIKEGYEETKPSGVG